MKWLMRAVNWWMWRLTAMMCCVGAGVSAWSAQELIIQTVAGTGIPGFNGDGQPAVQAHLNAPAAVAIDAQGNIYIADVRNHRIRRVDTNGIITTVAGTGRPGYSGDGGLATNAQLNQPLGIALDSKGNLFIADTLNGRIRMVDAAGIVTTVAGNGSEEFGGDNGPATEAMFARPVGLAVDTRGHVYVADVFNNRIRKFTVGGKISTVAGDGIGGYSGDGGPAVMAQLNRPRDVALDKHGNLYIADMDNHRIRRVGPDGVIVTVAGDGEEGYNGDGLLAVEAKLRFPRAVDVDQVGRILIADLGNHRIRRVELDGRIQTVVGNGQDGFSGDGGPATEASIRGPRDVAAGRGGLLLIADLDNHRIRMAR